MNKLTRTLNVVGLFVLLVMGISGLAYADHQEFEARLSGPQEVPEVVTLGRGRIEANFNSAFKHVRVDVTINELVGTLTGAHFHCARPGENGPVVFGLVAPGPLALEGNKILGTLKNADFNGGDCVGPVGRPVNNIAALAFAMRDGLIYLNVHTDSVPSGEIRGQMVEGHDDPTANPLAIGTNE